MRWWSARCGFLAVVSVAATLAVSADAGARPTGAERAALDIRSVTVRGEPSTGVLVSVRFRGDYTRRIGHGGLRHALTAMILRPRSSSARPTVLVDRGPGPLGDTLARARSRTLGSVRRGNRLDFFIVGSGLANVRAVVVKTFVRTPRARGARAAAGRIEVQVLSGIINGHAADVETVIARVGATDCAKLRRLVQDLDAWIQWERTDVIKEVMGYIEEDRAAGHEPSEINRTILRNAPIAAARLTEFARRLRVVFDLQGCEATGTAPPPQPPMATEAHEATWKHGTGRSNICVYVYGEAGDSGKVTLQNGSEQAFTLDSQGAAVVTFLITSAGTYGYTITAARSDGSQRSESDTVDVAQPPTDGPTPHSNLPCPAP